MTSSEVLVDEDAAGVAEVDDDDDDAVAGAGASARTDRTVRGMLSSSLLVGRIVECAVAVKGVVVIHKISRKSSLMTDSERSDFLNPPLARKWAPHFEGLNPTQCCCTHLIALFIISR